MFLISSVLGIGIDIAIVWAYYAFNNEPFQWFGFWIWMGVMISAGLLLWARRLLGFVVWYVLVGRDQLAQEAYGMFVENEFQPFNKEWDDVEGWLSEHIVPGKSSAAQGALSGLGMVRLQGIWQGAMAEAAYKKAAIKYDKYLKRRETNLTQ